MGRLPHHQWTAVILPVLSGGAISGSEPPLYRQGRAKDGFLRRRKLPENSKPPETEEEAEKGFPKISKTNKLGSRGPLAKKIIRVQIANEVIHRSCKQAIMNGIRSEMQKYDLKEPNMNEGT